MLLGDFVHSGAAPSQLGTRTECALVATRYKGSQTRPLFGFGTECEPPSTEWTTSAEQLRHHQHVHAFSC